MLCLVLWVCLFLGENWLTAVSSPHLSAMRLSNFKFVIVSLLLKQLFHCLVVRYFSLIGMKKSLEAHTDTVVLSMAGVSLDCFFLRAKHQGFPDFLWVGTAQSCAWEFPSSQHYTVCTLGVTGPWDTIHRTLSCWPNAKFGDYVCSSGNGKISVFLCFG